MTGSSSRKRVKTCGFLVWLLVLAAAGSPALAQTYGRGFVPPPDYDRIMAERLVVLPVEKTLPGSWDWRSHDGVTAVKDQGSCGSCWAFAGTAEMESKIRIYYYRELNLSEQQVISCNPYGSGCGGGWSGASYYVHTYYGGILENCMPYQASDAISCTQDDYLKFTSIDNWVSLSNNIDQIKTAIYNNGPVCTSVDANSAWDGYAGGVITAPGAGTNHLVLIVGWDDRVGANGAWIIKNSWGGGWGIAGYAYVAYGACNIGTGVTSLTYTPPPSRVLVYTPSQGNLFFGEDTTTISWATQLAPVSHVDIWFGTHGACQEEIIAQNLPNTGTFEWQVPNVTTSRATLVIYPSGGTHLGFGFPDGEFTILGYQTRYVSTAGSNTPPFDTPATAAHSIRTAVLAGVGRDTVLVAGGDYFESGITVNSQCHVFGGWSPDFTVCDPDLYPTRLRGVESVMRFADGAIDNCGVANITFHDSQAAITGDPVVGQHGAAILSMAVSPVIENCRFENNRANPGLGPGWGGAILAHGGSPIIRGCTFTGNIGSHGGAIALYECQAAVLQDCVFIGNTTSDSTLTNPGGAVYVHGGSANLVDCELRGGAAALGGGMAVAAGAVVHGVDLLVAANRSGNGGGGIYTAASQLALTRARLTENHNWAGPGGGLLAEGGDLELRNSAFAGNVAPGIGGGFCATDLAGGVMHNNVAHGNDGLYVGGIYVGAVGSLEFFNNAVSANSGGGYLVTGPAVAADWNLSYGNSGNDFLSPPAAHDLALAPAYADAAAWDFAPGMHSPLIDTGSPAAGEDWDGSAADRGLHGGAVATPAGPAAVADLAGAVVVGAVHLSWSPVAGAVTYVVYRDTSAVFIPAADLARAAVAAPEVTYQEIPPAGDWYYVVGAVAADGRASGFSERFETAGGQTPVGDGTVPSSLAIIGVAPNPFNPSTTVTFDLPRNGTVSLQIFDLRGRLVATLHRGTLPAGRHRAVWDGGDSDGRPAAAGIYLVRLDDGQERRAVKAVLAK